jgi:hypothetical protein
VEASANMAEAPRLLRRDGLQRWLLLPSAQGPLRVRKELEPALALDGRRARAWLALGEQNRAWSAEGCAEVLDLDAAQCAITSRYHPGIPLAQLGAVPSAVALALGTMIVTALEAAWEHGLTHLDLDPAGVLVRRDGALLLPEFGLWGALSPADLARVRFDAERIGYMSPEQLQACTVDTRSDLFVLGWLLYEWLAGRPPFVGDTPLALAMAIDGGTHTPLAECAPRVEPDVADVVETLLQAQPSARFESPRAARCALGSAAKVDLAAARGVLAARVAARLDGGAEPRTRRGLGLTDRLRALHPAPRAVERARPVPMLENPYVGAGKREPPSELVAPPPLFLPAAEPASPAPSGRPPTAVRAPRDKPVDGQPVHDGRTAFLKLETALRTVLPRSWQRTSARVVSAEGKWQEPSSTVFRVRPAALTVAVVRGQAWPRAWRVALALWFGGALLAASYLMCRLWF